MKISELHDTIVQKKVEIPSGAPPNIILFNNYTSKNEPYYIERCEDLEFIESLKINNIWLFGKSGVGKTALINRNLIQNKIEYCFCDLSPVTIEKAEDVLSEILCNVEEKFNIDRNSEEKNILKQVTQILCKSGSVQTVIVIDELSVRDDTIVKDIANKFIQLVIHFNNHSNEDCLKFVVSTMANPKNFIENRLKASDYFQYICCDSWSEYSSLLFDVLCGALNLELKEVKAQILENSKHTPRILKSILKKIVIYKDFSAKSIDKAIKMTIEEIVE